MPVYEYDCRKCGPFEVSQSINDRPLQRCPECRSKVTKLISATSFRLKGSGWYADGYSQKPGSTDSKKDTTATNGSKDKSPKEAKSKAKPTADSGTAKAGAAAAGPSSSDS